MRIECPECRYSADVDTDRIPAAGTNAKCPRCAARFFVTPPAPEPFPKEPDTLTCPKCGADQEQADICALCGLVFEKYRIAEDSLDTLTASSVDKQSVDRSLKKSSKVTSMRCGMIAAALGFVMTALLHVSAIMRSTSSTAAIGLIFVPMISLLWSLPFFAFGYSAGYVCKWMFSDERKFNFYVAVACVTAIGLFSAGARFAIEGLYLTDLVSEIQKMNGQELTNTINRPLLGKNKFVLGAIAQNKNATSELLRTIGAIDNSELYEKMGSLFDVLGENRRGLAVMRLVARNPNVLPETLEHLAVCTNDYVLGDVAGNDKTSQATLIKLSQRKSYLIDWGLARNPATPADILSSLSFSGEKYTREPVARNPGTPLKDLERLAVDSELIVRIGVANNPNVSTDILKILSNDANDSVRQGVLNNKMVAVDTLQKLSKEGDELVSHSAKRALKNVADPFQGSSIQTILEAMTGSDKSFRYRAAEALGNSGVKSPEVINSLISATNDSDELMRRTAVYALGNLGDKTALPVVEKLMKDKDQSVRHSAELACVMLIRPKGLDLETIKVLGSSLDPYALITGNYYRACWSLLAILQSPMEQKYKTAAVNALEKISGKKYGTNSAEWREWIEKNQDTLKQGSNKQ